MFIFFRVLVSTPPWLISYCPKTSIHGTFLERNRNKRLFDSSIASLMGIHTLAVFVLPCTSLKAYCL